MFSMNLCQNRKHQDLILPAVKLLLFLNQRWLAHVLKRRQWLVQKWQVKLNRSATSEVAEARPTDR